MKRLVIFDIDGTLLQSIPLQMMCLERALLGIFESRLSLWAKKEAQNTTDSGILFEMSQEILGRTPLPDEEARFRSLFLIELEEALDRGDEVIATPGADHALSVFRAGGEMAVSIATGGFESISKVKMSRAGLSLDGIPAAFAEDGFTKEEVLRTSRLRAEQHYATRFEEVIYIGDASYDVRAAGKLGFGFVGLGQGARRRRLIDCGARFIVPDLKHLHDALAGKAWNSERSRKRF
jgi:phosphoglycolate phosphatase-like HAD superfamily hydrolase